jgi:hypothetical protein
MIDTETENFGLSVRPVFGAFQSFLTLGHGFLCQFRPPNVSDIIFDHRSRSSAKTRRVYGKNIVSIWTLGFPRTLRY